MKKGMGIGGELVRKKKGVIKRRRGMTENRGGTYDHKAFYIRIKLSK